MSDFEFEVSAPGRICLFGEHQDFLGLPVISMAMDLRFHIRGRRIAEPVFRINMPDIGKKEEIPLTPEPLPYRHSRDYLRSSINILKRKLGVDFASGYEFEFTSEIPINAGCGSSSVMVVAWIKTLLSIADGGGDVDPLTIGELAYLAEVAEFGEAGGRMDQYTAALGGLLYLDFSVMPPDVRKLNAHLDGFVLGDSMQPKETLEVLKQSRTDVEQGIARLKELTNGEFDIKETPIEEAEKWLSHLPHHQARKVLANLRNRDYLREALPMLESGQIDHKRLGELLYLHHVELRDGLGVSTPKIDRMLERAMEAGAYGGKINGSGGGGTMFAYAPNAQEPVAEAIKSADGKAFIIKMSDGVKFRKL